MSDCKWCDPNMNDWDFKTIPYDLGDLGKYELTVSVSRRGMFIEFNEEHHDPLLPTAKIDIKYCPYCGRNLMEGEE